MQNQLMKLVSEICNTQSTNCRSLNKKDMARKIMDFAHIPTTANIQEIPLDWNNQVIILFLLPNDDNYYSLFCGIGCDNAFHFDLAITGKLIADSNIFDFYNDDKELNINHFVA